MGDGRNREVPGYSRHRAGEEEGVGCTRKGSEEADLRPGDRNGCTVEEDYMRSGISMSEYLV